MPEAEWMQVLQGSVSTGAKEGEPSTGCIWVYGMKPCYGPFSLGVRFEIYELFISLGR
jgi:hypothetical protein